MSGYLEEIRETTRRLDELLREFELGEYKVTDHTIEKTGFGWPDFETYEEPTWFIYHRSDGNYSRNISGITLSFPPDYRGLGLDDVNNISNKDQEEVIATNEPIYVVIRTSDDRFYTNDLNKAIENLREYFLEKKFPLIEE